MQQIITSTISQSIGLLALRVTLAGLMFWWGLVKGLGTGVGISVSDRFYGGLFSVDMLLIVFGWFQVVAAVLLALGLFRTILLPFQFMMNAFVAASIYWAFIDPFWLWMDGEKPVQAGHLFYPSIIVVAGSWLMMAMIREDRIALDRIRSTKTA